MAKCGRRNQLNKKMLAILLAAVIFSAMARADEPQKQDGDEEKDRPVHISPFSEIGTNALAVFSGSNGLIHLAAVGGTFVIVQSGLDTGVHNFFARNTFFDRLSRFGVSGGVIVPVALGRRIVLFRPPWPIIRIACRRQRRPAILALRPVLYRLAEGLDRPRPARAGALR